MGISYGKSDKDTERIIIEPKGFKVSDDRKEGFALVLCDYIDKTMNYTGNRKTQNNHDDIQYDFVFDVVKGTYEKLKDIMDDNYPLTVSLKN